ncbi:MAG: hypothetical protein OXU94_03705 [Gammaproteobacteria bacterium]|nr:hypothetical protein [Gammaproteobacteria bacterium]
MAENAAGEVHERIYYYTRLMLACIALAALLGGNLAEQINSRVFDTLFAPGAVVFFGLVGLVGYLAVRNHQLLKQLRAQ